MLLCKILGNYPGKKKKKKVMPCIIWPESFTLSYIHWLRFQAELSYPTYSGNRILADVAEAEAGHGVTPWNLLSSNSSIFSNLVSWNTSCLWRQAQASQWKVWDTGIPHLFQLGSADQPTALRQLSSLTRTSSWHIVQVLNIYCCIP